MKTPEEITIWCDMMLNRHPNIEDTNFFNSIKDYMKEQRPIGEWVYRKEHFEDEEEGRMTWGCNLCGHSLKSVHEKRNFCPNCGAMMGKDHDNENL